MTHPARSRGPPSSKTLAYAPAIGLRSPVSTKGQPSGALPLAALMLVLSYALFLAAWLVTDPPGAPPDEPVHYIKAVAAGHGQLRGDPPPGPAPVGTGI